MVMAEESFRESFGANRAGLEYHAIVSFTPARRSSTTAKRKGGQCVSKGQSREHWGSRIGVILAVAGSAVGLGNFLRFPGQAAQNGGGAFMLPYFISLLILGIPLCWAEWTMGRYGGTRGFNSSPGIFSVIWRNRLSKYFGGVALLIPLIIYMYYVLIEAWCLGYAVNYVTGDLTIGTGGHVDQLVAQAPDEYAKTLVETKGMTEELARQEAAKLTERKTVSMAFKSFFGEFVGSSADGAMLEAGNRKWLWVLLGTFVFNFILIYRGVSKGIETFCRFAMPTLVVLAFIVLIRVLTLGTPDPAHPEQSVLGGLNFMWKPEPGKLLDPETWLAASGQIFFSLSVGFGIIINYASYLRRNDDVVLSGLTSSSMNEFFEVCLGGLITLPAAFIFLGMAAGEQGTFDLGFVALPNVFALMPGGQFFGFLWFFMLFVAAVTSSVSMLQPVIAFLEEGFGLKRHASAAILGLIAALGCGFVLYFSKGLTALDTFDFWVGSVLIFVLATIQALLYGWAFGLEKGDTWMHQGAHLRVPRFVQLMLKYVVPVYLLAIFIAFCWEKLPDKHEPVFESSLTHADALNEGRLPDGLRSEFDAEEDVTLPDTFAVVAETPNGPWTLQDQDATPLFVLDRELDAETESKEVLSIKKYKFGYIAAIARDQVALSSVAFIATVMVFLLILVHIAGRRWAAEGRFDKI